MLNRLADKFSIENGDGVMPYDWVDITEEPSVKHNYQIAMACLAFIVVMVASSSALGSSMNFFTIFAVGFALNTFVANIAIARQAVQHERYLNGEPGYEKHAIQRD